MRKDPNIFFVACLFILLFCAIVTVLGRITRDVSNSVGEVLQFVGTIGGGFAIAGIGVFEILYPGQDILTRWKPMPYLLRQFAGRLVGFVFLIVAIRIISKTIF